MQTLKTFEKKARPSWIVHHDLSKVPAYFDSSPPPFIVNWLHLGKRETFTKENWHAAYGHGTLYGEVASMIELIDWLQQFHFLQNALITAIAIDCRWSRWRHYFKRHVFMERRYLTRSSRGSLILGINFFIGAIPLALSRSHHLYQEQLIIKSDTAIGITFLLPALESSWLSQLKVHRPFPHPLGNIWPSKTDMDNHRCWCYGPAGDCPTFDPIGLTSFGSCSGSTMGVRACLLPPMVPFDLGFCHCYAECRGTIHRRHAHYTCCDGLSHTNSLGPWCSLSSGLVLCIHPDSFIGYSFKHRCRVFGIVLTSLSSSSSFIAPKQKE